MKQGKRAVGTVFQRSQDGRWVVRYKLPSGQRLTRYAPDKASAEQLLASLMTDPSAAAPAPYTVSTWLDEFLVRDAKGKAASTAKDRANLSTKIKAGLGKVRLDKLTPAMVQRWSDKQEGSHRNRLKRLQLLRAALDQAMILGHVPRNVASPIKLERQPQPQVAQAWFKDEIAAFLAANEHTRLITLWRLGLQTGARIGELLALRTEDYDRHRGTLRIERTVTGTEGSSNRTGVGKPKTQSSIRTVPLSKSAQQTIEDQLQRRLLYASDLWQEQGWLFPNIHGGLLIYRNVLDEWKFALDRAPTVKRVRMHDMRTTFISLTMHNGAKQEVVAKIVGHKDSTITMRVYRQVYPDELEDVRDLLEIT